MGNRLLRLLAAAILMTYGFAKINGSQFTILDSELDKPMGQVSGFWLTWYYFGYSQIYGTFLALAQIVGAVLLTIDRTALMGACLLAPILLNIILIDVAYQVDIGATVVALLLLTVMFSVIAPRMGELRSLFLPESSSGPLGIAVLAWAGRVTLLAAAWGFTYWVANFNNRAPTPIDGAWDVVQVEPNGSIEGLPTSIFFEHNRAHLSVLKFKGGVYETRHFLADGSSSVSIWEKDVNDGPKIFAGSYVLRGADLVLSGEWKGSGLMKLMLRKRPVR
jgi:hypothetical protein